MKETSKLIMGATLVMVVTLAIVLSLILVLLAELYCSLLLRKRKLRITTTNANRASSQPTQNPLAPLGSFYSQGVLRAPRSFLFPVISTKAEEKQDTNKQHFSSEQVPESQTQEPIKTPHQIGLIPTSSPSPSFISVPSPRPIQEIALEASSSGCGGEHFVYISNPIYDNEACRRSRIGTPFETPDTSPSHLEMGNWSGERSSSTPSSLPITPPLSPMKKLPMEACSVSLRDARSLGTSGSESNNGRSSSSSSGSPCTSPSW